MKKLKILLYGVLLLAVAAGIFALKCYLSPIEIYEMPINAWKRKVWNIPGPTRKEENLVIYKVPVTDSVWHIISSKRLLESNDKYLCYPRKSEE